MRNKMAVILNYIQDDTQLRPLTQHRPIATLPIAGRYRLVDFIFSSMYNAEVVSGALFCRAVVIPYMTMYVRN